jgi:hypothetical protein
MRKINIEDEKLNKILMERAEVFMAQGEINKKLVELDKQRTTLGYKMERLKEKTEPIVEKFKPSFDLKEFEIIARVYLEDGKAYVDIVDMVEEYQEMLREKTKNK